MAFQFTDANFEQEVLQSDGPVLVDFYADWCGPCRMIAPVIEEIAGEFAGKAKVGKLNVEDSNAVAMKYGVMSIPTLIFFVNGQPVDKVVGAQPKQNLANKLNALL